MLVIMNNFHTGKQFTSTIWRILDIREHRMWSALNKTTNVYKFSNLIYMERMYLKNGSQDLLAHHDFTKYGLQLTFLFSVICKLPSKFISLFLLIVCICTYGRAQIPNALIFIFILSLFPSHSFFSKTVRTTSVKIS
jgi:hypothetical protein